MCLKGNSVMYSNISQKTIALLVTEAKLSAEVMIVQDMMFLYHVIMPLRLNETLPMRHKSNISGAVDEMNSWSV